MNRRKKPSPAATVILTQRSLADFREIERYSDRECGRKVADKYLDDLADALDRLRESPEILRLEPDLVPGLYFYRVRKHFLVCELSGETVTLLTVVHTSMDLPARLLELEPRLSAETQILADKLRLKREPHDGSE